MFFMKSCCCFYLQFSVQFKGDSGMWYQYGNKYWYTYYNIMLIMIKFPSLYKDISICVINQSNHYIRHFFFCDEVDLSKDSDKIEPINYIFHNTSPSKICLFVGQIWVIPPLYNCNYLYYRLSPFLSKVFLSAISVGKIDPIRRISCTPKIIKPAMPTQFIFLLITKSMSMIVSGSITTPQVYLTLPQCSSQL